MFSLTRVARFFAIFMLCAASVVHAKPRPPVSLVLQTDGQPGAELATFSVTATTAFETPDFAITIRPPHGASLEDGVLSWQGPLPADGSKTISFTLRLNKAKGVVRATAVVASPDGPRYAAHAVHPLNGAAASKVRPESSQRTQRFGRGVVEYRLDR